MNSKIATLKRFRLYIATLLIFAVVYISLKCIVPYLVVSYLRDSVDYSVKNQVKLENVIFNPVGLTLKIRNLALDKKTSLDSLFVEFDFPDLGQKEMHISLIKIEGLKGRVIKKGDSFLLDGVQFKDEAGKTNESISNWNVKIDKVEISNSVIFLNDDHKIRLAKVEVHNLSSVKNDNLMKFRAEALMNESNILIDGSKSQSRSLIDFKVKNLDLNILNSFIDSEDISFGKVEGQLSSQGSLELNDDLVKIRLGLELENVFIYSKDLKSINYFIKEAKAQNLNIENDKSSLSIKSSFLNISHLLLSVPSKNFRHDNLSKFAKIAVNNIDVSANKKILAAKGIIKFSDGGFFALNKYPASTKTIIDIKASGVDLTQFSSSFEPLLNYQIESGKLSLDSRTYLGKDKIKGKVKINLGQFSLDDRNELGEKIENNSFIPLKTAISMIKDDNGNLELDFNLYGNKNDPNFDILGMMGKGIGSVVISKISSIVATKIAVKYTPILLSSIPVSPGNIFMFTNGVYKIITKPRFKDIDFELQESDISQDSQLYLGDLVGFLKDNKKFKIRICPVASTLEFSEISDKNEATLSLANKRVEVLKAYFKQNTNNSDQIIFCRPKISDVKNIRKAVISL